MKKCRTFFMVILIASAIFMITSCEDANKQNENSLSRSVTINLSGVGNTGSRTLLPSGVVSPESYTFKLDAVKLGENGDYIADSSRSVPIQSFDAVEGNNYTLQNVPIGAYKITVEGYNASKDDKQKSLIMGGSTSTNTPFIVAPNAETNSVEIALQLISEGNYTGSISVKFDWSTAGGLIKSATDNGGVVFKMYYQRNSTGEYVEVAEQTSPEGATKFTFTAENVPVSTNSNVYFKVYNTQGQLLIQHYLSMTAQVYSGHESMPDSNEKLNEDGAFVITPDLVVAAKNIFELDWHFVEGSNDDAVITWSNPKSRQKENLIDSVRLWFYKEGSTTPINASPIVIDTDIENQDGTTTEVNSYTFNNMEAGSVYYMQYQAIHKSGYYSSIDTSDFANALKVRVPVDSISINTKNLPSSPIIVGEPFELSATVSPADATIKDYTWSVSDPDVLEITQNTFRAKKPGISTITATSTDNPEATQTTAKVYVKLNSTYNVTATKETAGISVFWPAVEYATSYEILRKTGNGEYITLKENVSDNTWLDGNIIAGETYSYKIIAKADSVSGFDVSSETSTATEDVTISGTSISLKDPVIVGETITFTEMTDADELVVTPLKGLTFGLAEEIPGAVTYKWYINEHLIETASTSFDDSQTIMITTATEGLIEGVSGATNYLKLVVTTSTDEYAPGSSYQQSFKVIKIMDEDVRIELYDDEKKISEFDSRLSDNPVIRVSSNTDYTKDNGRTIILKGHVIPGDADIKAIEYTTSTPDIISVSPYGTDGCDAIVSFTGSFGEAKILAKPTYGNPVTIVFDVYRATIDSALSLINIINEDMGNNINTAIASKKLQYGLYNPDWWTPAATKLTWSGTNISISNCNGDWAKPEKTKNGSIDYNNYTLISSDKGNMTINTNDSKDESITSIKLMPNDDGSLGNLGKDRLATIGIDGSKFKVELPYNQGTATLTYTNINVVGDDRNGSYNVSFDKSLGVKCFNPETGDFVGGTNNDKGYTIYDNYQVLNEETQQKEYAVTRIYAN